MTSATPPVNTDAWLPAQWAEYLELSRSLALAKAHCYFDSGWMRLEMSPLGALPARENSIVSTLVALFTTLKGLRMVELTNPTIRKTGLRDAQPDIAFYLGRAFTLPPWNNQPIDTDRCGAPQLVIEIASTTLDDDLGRKRLLYERLDSQEYWVVNVQVAQVIAFTIANGGSTQISTSQVLPGLAIATVEEALTRSQSEDDGTINRWLMATFTAPEEAES
ncbi:MAG: Uma2 family endonuclease [Leptolyngbyaceae cyanobacterium]